MSDNSSSSSDISEEEKLKRLKEMHNARMRRYRAHKTEAYMKCQSHAQKKFRDKQKEIITKYQELMDSGLLSKLQQLDAN